MVKKLSKRESSKFLMRFVETMILKLLEKKFNNFPSIPSQFIEHFEYLQKTTSKEFQGTVNDNNSVVTSKFCPNDMFEKIHNFIVLFIVQKIFLQLFITSAHQGS